METNARRLPQGIPSFEEIRRGGYLTIKGYDGDAAVYMKLSNAGGLAAAERQILDNGYAEASAGEGREVVALAVELEDEGRGIVGWKRVGE